MDRREPPPPPRRIITTDASSDITERLRPFARLANHPTTRRLATPRIIGALGLGLAMMLLLLVGGARTLRALAAWQHARPRHQLPFSKIELDPPTPRWILTGSERLLDQVRESAGYGQSIEALSEDLTHLRDAFAGHSPWVQRVIRIERQYPNRVIVQLVYREPVAKLGTEKARSLYLDREGIVLPASDIDEAAAGPLIALNLVGPQVVDVRAGQAMTVAQSSGAVPVTAPMRAAARLAAFLRAQLVSRVKNPPPFKIDAIYVDARSISLAIVAQPVAMVLWETTGPRDGGSPLGDDEKWNRLVAWTDAHDITKITNDEWLQIGRSGIVVQKR